MHLVSKTDQCVTIDGHQFPFERNETIFTECSYKYSVDDFTALASRAGWSRKQVWTDPGNLFCILYLTAG